MYLRVLVTADILLDEETYTMPVDGNIEGDFEDLMLETLLGINGVDITGIKVRKENT